MSERSDAQKKYYVRSMRVRFYTAGEVARIFGKTIPTIQAMCRRGELKYFRLPSRKKYKGPWRIDPDSVQEWWNEYYAGNVRYGND